VEWFEQEEIDLEEGIKKFEEGSKLVKELKEYLEKVENKIKELK
jgi:exodeoxyribonuclease VII small subunit